MIQKKEEETAHTLFHQEMRILSRLVALMACRPELMTQIPQIIPQLEILAQIQIPQQLQHHPQTQLFQQTQRLLQILLTRPLYHK